MDEVSTRNGRVLAGRYHVGEWLGRGGMAEVYRATDERFGRPVAVKLFRAGAASSNEARWRREVSTLARLTHPHLVTLYDAGEEDGHAYLVMQYVDGPNLAQSCGREPFDLARTAQIGAAVADALAYVHDRGVVHRDVKPANVLLDRSGYAYLADFGIARLVDGSRLTASGLLMGTASYLAPEQVRGAAARPESDVYALGLVLLECLTGAREYEGSALEVAAARLTRSPQIPGWLPPRWAALLREMTGSEPEGRPSAAHVAARLGEFRAPAPEVSPPTQHLAAPPLDGLSAAPGARTRRHARPASQPLGLGRVPQSWQAGREQVIEAVQRQGLPDLLNASWHTLRGRVAYHRPVLEDRLKRLTFTPWTLAGLAGVVLAVAFVAGLTSDGESPANSSRTAPNPPAHQSDRPLPAGVQADFDDLRRAVRP
ncbi:MAG: serine/threonine-protein kinase [Carbonactinosporaceae bacterium]